MTVAQRVFIDTSIQVQRTLGPYSLQAQIDSILSGQAIAAITSEYVWMEYQRSVVADFAHVHRVMCRCNDWAELFAQVLDGPYAFRPRSAVRCTKIISIIYTVSQQDIHIAQVTLAQHIQRLLYQRFWMHLTSIEDPIACDLVTTGINRQDDYSFDVPSTCRKETAACSLPKFLSDNRAKLIAIVDYLDAHPRSIKNQPKVQSLISNILEEPRAALGQTSCWPLGDIIIALQVPPTAHLWTTDADFKALATALGVQIYSPNLA